MISVQPTEIWTWTMILSVHQKQNFQKPKVHCPGLSNPHSIVCVLRVGATSSLIRGALKRSPYPHTRFLHNFFFEKKILFIIS